MKRFYLVLVLAMLVTNLFGQTKLMVTGSVTDTTGEALFGASIVNRTDGTGTSSNNKGEFELRLNKLPAYLELSFIGFKTQYVVIQANDFKNGVANLHVKLAQREEVLASVTVTGEAYENYFTHPGFEVLDFTFVEENTLLLLKYKRDYKLVLLNELQDSLAYLALDGAAEAFVKDCLNQHYLLCKDSLFSLSFANNGIQMLSGVSLEFYNQKVRPCVGANGQSLYYVFYEFNNQLQRIYQSPITGEAAKEIRSLVDMDNALSIAEYGNQASAMLNGSNPMLGMNLEGLALFKEGFERMAWFKNILSLPIYNPIFATTNGAILFNHLSDSIQVLNHQAKTEAQYFITYHKNKNFKNRILQDQLNGDFYVYFESGGICTLGMLNHRDFSIKRYIQVHDKDFPVALKIRGGVAYFLDYDKADLSRLKLYRQNLR